MPLLPRVPMFRNLSLCESSVSAISALPQGFANSSFV